MDLVRIRVEFDLTITDDQAARQHAVDAMRAMTKDAEAAGASIVTEGASPEVTMHDAAQGDPLVQTFAVQGILANGLDRVPFVTISDLTIQHLA